MSLSTIVEGEWIAICGAKEAALKGSANNESRTGPRRESESCIAEGHGRVFLISTHALSSLFLQVHHLFLVITNAAGFALA